MDKTRDGTVNAEKIVAKLQALEGEKVWEVEKLLFVAERSVALVKAYCRMEVVPKQLEGVCVSLAGQLYEKGLYSIGHIKSLQEGNVSVTWEYGEKDVLLPFVGELQKVRRMGW